MHPVPQTHISGVRSRHSHAVKLMQVSSKMRHGQICAPGLEEGDAGVLVHGARLGSQGPVHEHDVQVLASQILQSLLRRGPADMQFKLLQTPCSLHEHVQWKHAKSHTQRMTLLDSLLWEPGGAGVNQYIIVQPKKNNNYPHRYSLIKIPKIT